MGGGKGLLGWWHVQAPTRDGTIREETGKHNMSKVLGLVWELICKVREKESAHHEIDP